MAVDEREGEHHVLAPVSGMNGEGSAAPTAISQDTVRLVLLYISQALPLPPHLLSRPLLQRHYFLNIGPDDYIPYLAWSGASSQHLAEGLNGFSLPSDDECPSYPAVYTSDPDSILAHVCVAPAEASSGSHIRLVFLWDSEDATWKYYNLSLMPFPQDSVSSIDRLTSQTSFDLDAASYWGPSDQSDNEVCDHGEQSQSGSDDDYWVRYSAAQGQFLLIIITTQSGTLFKQTLHHVLHQRSRTLDARKANESWCPTQ